MHETSDEAAEGIGFVMESRDHSADLVEGLPLGSSARSVGRTISEGEFALLHSLSWAISEVHANKHLMTTSGFDDRVLAGPMLTAVVAGLQSTGDQFDRVRREHNVTFLAVLGIDAKYFAPVIPGDTIWVDTTLTSARPSTGRPGTGVMIFRDVATNQRGEVVLEMERPMLFTRTAQAQSLSGT